MGLRLFHPDMMRTSSRVTAPRHLTGGGRFLAAPPLKGVAGGAGGALGWAVLRAGTNAEGEALRRFEFVGGSSAKFWEAGVEGASFVVTYGRLGTSGQRKAKAFATEAEAKRECDKKIAEKLREGYVEAGAAAPAAPAAPVGPVWPARRSKGEPSAEQVAEATRALGALGAALGGRSWVTARAARRAARAVRPLGALSPESDKAFTAALEGVLGRVGARGGLALADAMALLGRLDARFFERALGLWGSGRPPRTIGWLAGQAEALGGGEAALGVGLLATDRGRHPLGLRRRREALFGPLDEHLKGRGSSVESWARSLDAGGDAALGRALGRLRAGG